MEQIKFGMVEMDESEMVSERERGKGVGFERIRRITGYLVGTVDRFNSAKQAEESQRVKHGYDKLSEIEARSRMNVEVSVKEKVSI